MEAEKLGAMSCVRLGEVSYEPEVLAPAINNQQSTIIN